jgi:aspartate ammonia-lyase
MSKIKKYRVEEDSLGKKKVDINAFYGIQTVRASENFNVTGYTIDDSLIIALAMVKKSAALANCDAGKLKKNISELIVAAADEIINGKYHDQFIVDPIQGGAGTSINMNMNEVITNIALTKLGHEKGSYDIINPIDHVNMSQSTNDTLPTAIHIAALMSLKNLIITLENLIATFKNKSIEFDGMIKIGRTHLQDAIPIRLGQEFGAYSSVLERDLIRIKQCRQNLYEVNIGATVIGTGLNAERCYIDKAIDYLKEFSEFPVYSATDSVDAMQNTDSYTELSSVLKICVINMSKISNDLRLMASGPRAGLNEINLPPCQQGSSLIPGKVNPVMVELINQVAFQVMGNDQTISLASEAGQFELNVMVPVIVFNLLQSMKIINNAFESFNELCLKGISANREQMKEYVDYNVGILSAILPYIGYEKATNIAKKAIETGECVRKLCLKHTDLTKEELNIIFNEYEMTTMGIAGFNQIMKKDIKD